jgi:phosphatidylinositol alpha-1,6-mannosyltransferase
MTAPRSSRPDAERHTVLALVTDAFGGKGGIAQYNRDLLSAWVAAASVVVLPRGGGAAGRDTVSGLRQLPPVGSRLAYALHSIWHAWRLRPDVVFCGHLYMVPLALATARVSGARLVLQVHGIDAWTNPGRLPRWAAERADLVLSVSRYTRAMMLTWAAIAPYRVKVLPNTVASRFIPADRAAAREVFGLGQERVILSVGRLDARERYKGQDRVIAALPDLLRAYPDTVYCIAGEGDDRARLERLVHERGLHDVVRFLGSVPDADLPDLYRAADLFALPSTGEGFGIVFLEAMACGTPALGLAEAGAVDALADGQLGRACRPEELIEALREALTSDVAPERADVTHGNVEGLAAAVRQFFGVDVFRARARGLLKAALA